jgi:arsenate reductase (thioredoxin)
MKHRVLFLCVGNACRSQMAEGFARAYGHDVIDAVSAGLSPSMAVDPTTRAVMNERGIDLGDQFPKPVEMAAKPTPTLVINMSGAPIPHTLAGIKVEQWRVRDPIGEAQGVHREVRDQLEYQMMNLILRLRQQTPAPSPNTPRFKFGRMG